MIPMTLLEVVVAFVIVWFLRFAVIQFSIKSVLKVSYFILTFIALRLLLNYKASQTNEVLEHLYFKEKIISIKKNDEVQFVMKHNLNTEKIGKFIIEPYLTSRRTRNCEVKIIPDETEKIVINGKNYKLK